MFQSEKQLEDALFGEWWKVRERLFGEHREGDARVFRQFRLVNGIADIVEVEQVGDPARPSFTVRVVELKNVSASAADVAQVVRYCDAIRHGLFRLGVIDWCFGEHPQRRAVVDVIAYLVAPSFSRDARVLCDHTTVTASEIHWSMEDGVRFRRCDHRDDEPAWAIGSTDVDEVLSDRFVDFFESALPEADTTSSEGFEAIPAEGSA